MSSIQSIDHSSLTAEQILSKATGPTGKARNRTGAEIVPEPPANSTLSTGAAADGSGPGIPRAHPPEGADNLLARMPGRQDQMVSNETEAVRTPPESPGQLAVLLLSMLSQAGSSSDTPGKAKHTLDVMA